MDAYLFSKIVFFITLAVMFLLPHRMMILAYIIMCNLDVPGIANFIKIIIVPVLILYKLKDMKEVGRNNFFHLRYLLWFLFMAYAAMSIIWTQTGNYIAGLKFVSSLVGIFLFYQVFKKSYYKKLIDSIFLTNVIWVTLLLAVIQTYVLDSRFGVEFDRFTGFVASQQYASFLVGLIALVLWSNDYSVLKKICI